MQNIGMSQMFSKIFRLVAVLLLIIIPQANVMIINDNEIFRTVPYKESIVLKTLKQCDDNQSNLKEKYKKCQEDFASFWQLNMTVFFTESNQFCCFVNDVLKCETKVLTDCTSNQTFSKINTNETNRLFGKSCNDFTEDKCIWKRHGFEKTTDKIILISIALVLGLVIFGVLFYICYTYCPSWIRDPFHGWSCSWVKKWFGKRIKAVAGANVLKDGLIKKQILIHPIAGSRPNSPHESFYSLATTPGSRPISPHPSIHPKSPRPISPHRGSRVFSPPSSRAGSPHPESRVASPLSSRAGSPKPESRPVSPHPSATGSRPVSPRPDSPHTTAASEIDEVIDLEKLLKAKFQQPVDIKDESNLVVVVNTPEISTLQALTHLTKSAANAALTGISTTYEVVKDYGVPFVIEPMAQGTWSAIKWTAQNTPYFFRKLVNGVQYVYEHQGKWWVGTEVLPPSPSPSPIQQL